MPPWHPDLRNVERLPDTKIVRTAFFVNGAAVFALAAALLWALFEAYQWHEYTAELAAREEQIASDQAPVARALQLHKKYQEEETRIREVEQFVGSRPVVSDILLQIAEKMPAYLALERLDVRETGMTLRATVRGTSDQASGNASAYLEMLKTDPYFAEKFKDIRLLNLNRNVQTGRMTAEIALTLK